MSLFQFQNQQLFVEDLSIEEIAKQVETPFYVYSASMLEQNYLALTAALSELNHLVCYAVKANSNQAVLRTFARLGCGADVVSLGELKRALNAGISADKIVFSGVGKTPTEIQYAIEQGILQFNVESPAELLTINAIAVREQTRARVAIRINPDVAVDTHAKITTGTAENKFGIAFDDAIDVFVAADELSAIEVQGIHVHIGSQITDVTPYRAAYKRVAQLHQQLNALNIPIPIIDLGGGFGVCYDRELDHNPDMAQYQRIVLEELGHIDCTFIVEPGRSLTANAGCLVSKVIYEKPGKARNFLIIDAAMNDFARPSLYDAYHQISPISLGEKATEQYDVVGPVCESGDTFAVKRQLPKMKTDDLLVLQDCGAYGAVMGSTYNTRPLIAEVMVKNNQYSLIRPRQNLDELIGLDQIPNWL